MELNEAQDWLEGLINVERMPDFAAARLGLGAIEALLARVSNPQRGLPVLHIAGSKGKGSTALLAESVSVELGVRTGTFTSPHLCRWTERFRIDGVEVADEALADVLTRLRPHVDALRDGPEPPSFFDATTAAAFLLFAEASVEVAILEVGLGGRLDSTNACEPVLTAITSIELEHTEKLGDTHAQIAREKAGIAKPGIPLVLGDVGADADAAITQRARAVDAPLIRFRKDFDASPLPSGGEMTRFRYSDGPLSAEFELATPGRHQVGNAAVALACLRRLALANDDELVAAGGRAFAQLRLPGRVEILSRRPFVVVDGAHTKASAAALAAVLGDLPHERSALVLSVSAGKDLASICAALAPYADEVTITRADEKRSLAPAAMIEAIRAAAPAARVHVEDDPARAVERAQATLGSRDLLCVTGSIYLAGIARRVLAPR